LTGQRRSEIAALEWAEVDLEKKVITLPPLRTKNGSKHTVPLSPLAVEILEAQPREGKYVFGRYAGPFSGFGKAKAQLDEQLGDMPPWRVHDLRHTFSTRLGDLGEKPHVIDAATNHKSGVKKGITGRYNHSVYLKEVTAAMNKWARHLAKVVGHGG
jgi:integrase